MEIFKPIDLKAIPKDVYAIFKIMYKAACKPSLKAQAAHGVFLSFYICVFIAWTFIAYLFFIGYFDFEAYGTVCFLFFMIAVFSSLLNSKLKDSLGLSNPLSEYTTYTYTATCGVSKVMKALESKSAVIYQPPFISDSDETIDSFIELMYSQDHCVYVLQYLHPISGCEVFHVIDSTMIYPLHVSRVVK